MFKHDCPKCEYLGNFSTDDGRYDVYTCPGVMGLSVILRYGDDGWSGLV